MIQKNASSFVFPLLILLSISQLLCHSQKILKTSVSIQDILIDNNSASTVSEDPINTELPEEFTNEEITILLGNDLDLDVNLADGSKKLIAIPNSGEFGEFKETNSFIRSFPDKGGIDNEEYDETLDKIRSSDPKNFKVPEKVMPIYPKTVLDEVEKDSQKSSSSTEKLKNSHEFVSNVLSTNPYHIQVNTEEWQTNFLSNFEKININGKNSFPQTQLIKLREETSDITGEKNKLYPMNQDVIFGISSTIASNSVLLQNNNKLQKEKKITSDNGDHSLQYVQPVKPKEKIWGIVNKTNKPPNQEGDKTFGISFSSTKSHVAALQDNNERKYNNEITNSKNTILNRMWNGKYTYYPEKIHEKTDFLRDLGLENDYGDFERENQKDKRHFHTVHRDVKSSQESQASRKPYTMKESPLHVSSMNNTVKEDALKMLINNRTQNLEDEAKVKECEKGSDACLKCREISPYCHYNYRSKVCFYADVKHGNTIYECGVRFFTADGYMPFFIAIGMIIVCSLIVLFFLARAFYRRILQKDPITDMEVEDVRNIVHLIREKRSM